MRFGFDQRARLLLVLASAVLIFVMTGCGNSSIVGRWGMSGTENQTVWEFLSNGSVLVGEVRGKYKFGDQDRIKIETPFATTVYLVKLSSDHSCSRSWVVPSSSSQGYKKRSGEC